MVAHPTEHLSGHIFCAHLPGTPSGHPSGRSSGEDVPHRSYTPGIVTTRTPGTERSPAPHAAAVVVPVKDFRQAKRRLAPELDPDARAALARSMATAVVAAAAPLPAYVVCDDETVRDWSDGVGAHPLWTPGVGLDGAVRAGVDALRDAGFAAAIVAHSDLPLAESFAWLVEPAPEPGTVTIVPDRRLDGTNVIVVPTDADFGFAYGPASFTRHRAEARRLGLAARVVRDDRLGWDVDVPADLELPVP